MATSPYSSLASGNTYTPAVSAYNSGSDYINNFYSALQSGRIVLDRDFTQDSDGFLSSSPAIYDSNGTKIVNSSYDIIAPGIARVNVYGGNNTTAQYYLNYDTKTGYAQPVQNYSKQAAIISTGGGGGFLSSIIGGLSSIISDLGPLGQLGLAYATAGIGSALAAELGISAAAGTALASTAAQVAQGVPLDSALTNAATSYIGGTVSSAVNSLVDEVGAATNYGTDIGSQQTAMLAAQDAGMNTVADLTGNAAAKIAGSTVAGTLAGQDVGQAATSGLINAGTSTLSSVLAGTTPVSAPNTSTEPSIFEDTTSAVPAEQALSSTIDQEQPNTPISITPDGNVDAQGNPTYIDAQGNPVDINGTAIPNANERTPVEGGGFKTVNPDGSVTYEDPDGSVYKVNADGTYTTQSMGQTNTYNPATDAFTQPTPTTTTTTSTPSSGLSEQQISNILKVGTGLLTGSVVAPVIVNALTGAGSTSTPTTTTTTPSTGTNVSSALNPYNAAYFQQVQQNYNRLFPTAPADITTPLQSWYNTQYVPDTSISKKLFGV